MSHETPTRRWTKPPKRIVIKLSGEALSTDNPNDSISEDEADRIASEIAAVKQEYDLEIGIVIGGGNIWRGALGKSKGMNKTRADQMGMLAGIINVLMMTDALERHGVTARAMTALPINKVMEPYIPARASRHLEKGRVVLFAAGLGEPNFTHDTAAAQRGIEVGAQLLLKGTHGTVDGVYEADPKEHPEARKYSQITFHDAFSKRLKVMDLTAFALCEENQLDLLIFSILKPGNLRAVVAGEQAGTLVVHEGETKLAA